MDTLAPRASSINLSSGMKIYSWNMNGIRAVAWKGELQPFLDKPNPHPSFSKSPRAGSPSPHTELYNRTVPINS